MASPEVVGVARRLRCRGFSVGEKPIVGEKPTGLLVRPEGVIVKVIPGCTKKMSYWLWDGFESSLCSGGAATFEVKVPDGRRESCWCDQFKEMDVIQFTGPDGRVRSTFVPAGVGPGQRFTVMLQHDGPSRYRRAPFRPPPRDPVEEMAWTPAARFLAGHRS